MRVHESAGVALPVPGRHFGWGAAKGEEEAAGGGKREEGGRRKKNVCEKKKVKRKKKKKKLSLSFFFISLSHPKSLPVAAASVHRFRTPPRISFFLTALFHSFVYNFLQKEGSAFFSFSPSDSLALSFSR